jgi:hypothetical protein
MRAFSTSTWCLMLAVNVDESDVHLVLFHIACKGLLICTCCCLLHSHTNDTTPLSSGRQGRYNYDSRSELTVLLH